MYVRSKKRTSKSRAKTKYRTRTVVKKEGGDKVYYFGGGYPQSGERREREWSAPERRSSGSGILAPIVGLALIGGAVGGFYWWYSKNKCATLNEQKNIDGKCMTCLPFPTEDVALFNTWQDNGDSCSGGTDCSNGQTKCVDGKSYVCSNNKWVEGGSACQQSCDTPDANCINGAVKCNSSLVKLECTDGCWKPIGNCASSDCTGFSCNSAGYGCDGTTLFYSPTCNPETHDCQYTRFGANNAICLDTTPDALEVTIGGYPILMSNLIYPVEISTTENCEDPNCDFYPCGHRGKYNRRYIDVVVYDRADRPVEGATITVVPRSSTALIKFIKPGDDLLDYGDMEINDACGTYDYTDVKTDVDGTMRLWFFVTWDLGFGASAIHRYRLSATKDGKTIYQDFDLKMVGHQENKATCENVWQGSSEPKCEP